MGSIARYIFRSTFSAFVIVLVTLTAIVWITHAIRDLDLITGQGQTILAFLGITGLLVPLLAMIVAPLALVIAMTHVLNRLSSDSELVVMNASGLPPWRAFGAFFSVAIVVSALVALLAADLSPRSLRTARDWVSEVRANLLASLAQPGRFAPVQWGLTFHIRERAPDGTLLGIFIDDQRDAKLRSTFLADAGTILKNESGTYLLLQAGNVQRQEPGGRDPAIVNFDRYAYDLSRLSGGAQVGKYGVREQFPAELVNLQADENSPERNQARAELADRIAAPLYPLAFCIVAFAYLGLPRSTRESRELAVAGAILAVIGLRMAGFASTVVGAQMPAALALQFVVLAAASAAGLFVIARGLAIEPPAALTRAIASLTARFERRSLAT